MTAYESLSTDDRKKTDELLQQTHAHDGLAPVDLDRFWADQEVARRNPFGHDLPQVHVQQTWASPIQPPRQWSSPQPVGWVEHVLMRNPPPARGHS